MAPGILPNWYPIKLALCPRAKTGSKGPKLAFYQFGVLFTGQTYFQTGTYQVGNMSTGQNYFQRRRCRANFGMLVSELVSSEAYDDAVLTWLSV